MTAGYDFWLVDLDGTLIDVEPAYAHRVIERVGERIGYPFTQQEAEQLWHGLGGSPDDLLVSWDVDPKAFWTAFHDIENPRDRAASSFLYPDARVIESLSCPIGLVTHCQSYLTEPVLDTLEIRDWFDVIVCCHDGIGWKPDPAPVERAMAALEVSNGDHFGVLVGDSAADVGAAWNAGLDAVHVERHGPERRGCCVRADTRITNIEELVEAPTRPLRTIQSADAGTR